MLRNLLFFLFVVALGALCTDARRMRLPGGTRLSCATFGKGSSNRTICIKQHGRSGKFSIGVGKKEDENDPKVITIEFDAIREKDSEGNTIGKTGPKDEKHSFENFEDLDFAFSDLVNTSYEGIAAYGFDFNTTIPGSNASLNVPIYIFKENGTIDLCDDEQVEVVRGMVKYNIELSNWSFCKADLCRKGNTDEIGEYVEFVIQVKNVGKAVKGKKDKKLIGKKRKAMKFFFGNNSISFPSAVKSDGGCKEMPEEYPKLEPKVGKHSVIFRFSKFNDKVIYDPGVILEGEVPPDDTDTDDDSGVKLLCPSFGLVMILGVLARLFF